MLEEQAEVTEIDGETAWVACRAQQDCLRCAEGRGCGGGLLGKWLGDRLHRVQVNHFGDIRVGDCVVIGLDERLLVALALRVYGLPLVLMLAGAALGSVIGTGDAAVGLGMAAGLAAGFAWLQLFSRKIGAVRRFRPSVVRRVVPAESE